LATNSAGPAAAVGHERALKKTATIQCPAGRQHPANNGLYEVRGSRHNTPRNLAPGSRMRRAGVTVLTVNKRPPSHLVLQWKVKDDPTYSKEC
jgi:hypothetical protein